MRIGLLGVGGTGKSTVMNLMADKGYTSCPSQIRDFFKSSGRVESSQDTMAPSEVWDLQKSIFDWKVDFDRETLDGNSVYDRTLLDHYIYCLHRCAAQVPASVEASMLALVRENLVRYDVLFYFPYYPEFNREDGFRQVGTIQRAQDLMIRGLLAEMDFEVFYVPIDTPEARLKHVLEVVASKERV